MQQQIGSNRWQLAGGGEVETSDHGISPNTDITTFKTKLLVSYRTL
ncbi:MULTISPECIES: hypothetical protein [unclassified Burkholderia]|nr:MULTISPECIES: hypothetical protein [unclassified Burkholderia]